MADFAINGTAYQSQAMDGDVQVVVLKRLLPTVAALMGCNSALKAAGVAAAAEAGGATDADPLVDKRDALMPVARELAALTDADVRFILDACMDVTKRQVATGVGWVGVKQRGMIQDQTDKQFKTRLTIAWHVLAENFEEILTSFGLDVKELAAVAPQS